MRTNLKDAEKYTAARYTPQHAAAILEEFRLSGGEMETAVIRNETPRRERVKFSSYDPSTGKIFVKVWVAASRKWSKASHPLAKFNS